MTRAPRRVLFLQYVNPAVYPPLEHSSRILGDAGWQVLFLGIDAHGEAGALRFLPHRRVQVRRLPYCAPGWRQKLHYAWFALVAMGIAIGWRPTWLYASDLLACPTALVLSFFPWIRLVYHEHDSPDGAPLSRFVRLCLGARRLVARRAAVCVLPNAERVRAFEQDIRGAKHVVCVHNYPSRGEVGPPRAARRAEQLRLYYHGSIVPVRLPVSVVRALAQLPDGVRLSVAGYETVGHGGYARVLREEAERLGIKERLEFLGAVPQRHDLLAHCRRQDVGLALMPAMSGDVNMHHMVGASNKAFDYLASGAALLISDLPAWRTSYVEPGYALACNPNDPDSIAAALRWFLAHPAETRVMGELGRRRILAEWHYEAAFAPVLNRMLSSG